MWVGEGGRGQQRAGGGTESIILNTMSVAGSVSKTLQKSIVT